MKTKILITSLAVLLVLGLTSASAQDRGPSTPEERQRAVEIATLLENEPLHKNAKALSKELLVWLIEVPDISVTLCTAVFGDYSKIKGEYSPVITGQFTFSQAKFVIEHPDKANDQHQIYLAGVEGALKAYQNLKIAKSKVKMEPLEILIAKQQAGQLSDFVRESMKNCK